MPEVIFGLDSTKRFREQEKIGHNRWHPAVPPVATVKPGATFRVHCRERFNGEIHNNDSADDVRDAPLSIVDALSGPFAVQGAEPGDLLLDDILDVGPIPQEDSGPLAGQGCPSVICNVRPSASGPTKVKGGKPVPKSSF